MGFPSSDPLQLVLQISQGFRFKCDDVIFSWETAVLLPPPRHSYHPLGLLMALQREIKVSQISALLHNVPDTPFCKQFFLFFGWKNI